MVWKGLLPPPWLLDEQRVALQIEGHQVCEEAGQLLVRWHIWACP